MRKTFKRLFTENSHLLTGGQDVSVKVESADALYGYSSSGRGRWRRTGATSGRYPSGNTEVRDARLNPTNNDGHISVCAICSSKMHWARKCPHAREKQSALYGEAPELDEEEVHITLMAGNITNHKMDALLGETLGHVLLDSGCSKTVCGERWLREYLQTMSDSEKKKVIYESSNAIYRFGDGSRMSSLRSVLFPCVLAGKKINIKSDVVECSIPLL